MEESRGVLERTGGSQVLESAEEKGKEVGGQGTRTRGWQLGTLMWISPWSESYLYVAPDSWV